MNKDLITEFNEDISLTQEEFESSLLFFDAVYKGYDDYDQLLSNNIKSRKFHDIQILKSNTTII